jgi:periplasmic protein TonB
MDLEPERGNEGQNLAADRRDQFSGSGPEPAAAARSSRRFLVKLVAVSLLAHGCLVLAILLLDLAQDPPEGAHEIPVELVKEPPPPEPKPAAPQAGEKSAGPRDATQAANRESPQKPETAVNPKPASEPTSDPHPAAPPQSAKGGQETKSGSGAKSPPSAPVKLTHKDAAKNETAHQQPPAAKLEGGPARQDGGTENRWAAQTGFTLPFDTGPDRFRAVAVPLPDASGGEAMSYKVIVFGVLARVKHYPESAIQRGAKGIAVVGFVLDDLGGVVSVALLRSSGDADLDAESVALVNRAAPFPPPPPGAERSFAAEVAFGIGH